MTVGEHLRNLAEGGLDFTVIGRRLLIWDSATSIGRTRQLTDADFTEHTRMVFVETPANPTLRITDLRRIVELAHRHGAIVAVDNTFMTPVLQRPLTLGADVVVQSATKYLAGHSDLLMGVTVTGPEGSATHERLARHRQLSGAVPGPMETWLALRGLRTLAVRLERACANAAELAARLGDHPRVHRVRYPGFGAIVSIEVDGGAEGAERHVRHRIRRTQHA